MKKRIPMILSAAMLLVTLMVPGKVDGATLTSVAGAVTTEKYPLNVRASASTGSAILSSVKKGSYITLISKSDGWWKVEYARGQYGYCHADYITPVQGTPATVTTQSQPLNVRSGPGTSYQRLTSLPKGEVVIRLSTSGGWSRVLYSGIKTGYVSTEYLSSETSVNAGISLSVPYFKQADSRWANTAIGTSGKTMAQIGCATTAIAMLESYRTGTTITPDAMSKKLNYTSSGNVYWPSNFVAVTDSSGYLNGVYQQLKQGKPVLFGAKKSSGTQHWVVITGFSGGSITASNFTIRDPGTDSRVNLQQFLNSYPIFYKYFYYK